MEKENVFTVFEDVSLESGNWILALLLFPFFILGEIMGFLMGWEGSG
jgi:hypothetical protein